MQNGRLRLNINLRRHTSILYISKQRGIFNRRKKDIAVEGVPGVFKEHVMGRVYRVHPNNSEYYYLRLLLHTVRGPSSFHSLRKVDDIEHRPF